MKSIQQKIMLLTTVAIIMVAIVVGTSAVYNLIQVGEYDSAQILNLTCDKEAAAINRSLYDAEEAVSILADYAEERLFSVEKLAGDEGYRDSYTVQLGNIFANIAVNVPGTIAYFVVYNPAIIESDGGLYYVRDASARTFGYQEPIDIAKYEKEDKDFIAWWYEPLETGEPTWIDPFYDPVSEREIISFIIPLYAGDILIGEAGVDIDFSEIIENVKSVTCYETGYVCLADSTGRVFYNPHYEKNTPMSEMDVSEGLSFEAESNGEELSTYYLGKVQKQMAYKTLANGMRLIITAPTREINAVSNNLVRQVIVSTILVLFIFFFVTLMVSRRITEPLKELADVARKINEGELEVTFPKETKDEVGALTHVLEKMVHHLKHHIDDLNSLAFHDSLTGVKNKTAYDEAIAKLDEIEGDKEYGIVVMDANNLKKINDTYGHEKGNIYLKNACKLTCKVFKGSPVFRIGGDEFVVILQGADYENCYKLMRDFDVEAEKHNKATANDWEKINIAKGMVKYDPETDQNAEAVFKRADARMYVAKQKMKLAEIQ
ncbi:diguanylate cyclase domain-containing protein [Butyrivibrio sp. WCD3002]|uniref:diguanylate cyclase domain-containing protein n=1 Tax=Butyrivibrio sp. WCD3002 TaxID=1280676 RepID=UPI000423A46F|nr:diguanylate cyclase [Butyrivibrio sp. WCD3002]